jgi:hypothetical protein
MFSLARALFSPDSAGDCSSLFVWFIDVGSEEARVRAGLRPDTDEAGQRRWREGLCQENAQSVVLYER